MAGEIFDFDVLDLLDLDEFDGKTSEPGANLGSLTETFPHNT